MRTRSSALATLTLVVTSALVAACGGGGSGDDDVASLSEDEGGGGTTSTTLSEEEAEAALIDWAECMRGEGLDVPDPQIGENGEVQIAVGVTEGEGDEEGNDPSSNAPPDRDAFEAASEKCGEPPQIGGEFTEEDREEMEAKSLEFAECMRDNGVPDFPDPDFSDSGPGSGPQRRSSEDRDTEGETEDDGPTIAGPFGEVDLGDPEVAAAFEECRDIMGMPEMGEGPPGAGGNRDVRPATRVG